VIVESEASIRAMQVADLDAVMAIEESVYQFPWTRKIFFDCLHIGYHCRVCEGDRGLLGYSIASSAVGEAHILNLCVALEYRGYGIGRHLLESQIQEFRRNALNTVFLEVRESNQIAIALYDRLGFNEIGRRRAYYPAQGGREDALILALNLTESL